MAEQKKIKTELDYLRDVYNSNLGRRVRKGALSQWASMDKDGNVGVPLINGAGLPGMVDDTLSLPAIFYDPSPNSLVGKAAARTDRLSEALAEMLDLDPEVPDTEAALGESLGAMLAQLPLPASALKSGLKRAPGLLRGASEFFSPIVEPKIGNYAIGTAFGTGLNEGMGLAAGDSEYDSSLLGVYRTIADKLDRLKRSSDPDDTGYDYGADSPWDDAQGFDDGGSTDRDNDFDGGDDMSGTDSNSDRADRDFGRELSESGGGMGALDRDTGNGGWGANEDINDARWREQHENEYGIDTSDFMRELSAMGVYDNQNLKAPGLFDDPLGYLDRKFTKIVDELPGRAVNFGVNQLVNASPLGIYNAPASMLNGIFDLLDIDAQLPTAGNLARSAVNSAIKGEDNKYFENLGDVVHSYPDNIPGSDTPIQQVADRPVSFDVAEAQQPRGQTELPSFENRGLRDLTGVDWSTYGQQPQGALFHYAKGGSTSRRNLLKGLGASAATAAGAGKIGKFLRREDPPESVIHETLPIKAAPLSKTKLLEDLIHNYGTKYLNLDEEDLLDDYVLEAMRDYVSNDPQARMSAYRLLDSEDSNFALGDNMDDGRTLEEHLQEILHMSSEPEGYARGGRLRAPKIESSEIPFDDGEASGFFSSLDRWLSQQGDSSLTPGSWLERLIGGSATEDPGTWRLPQFTDEASGVRLNIKPDELNFTDVLPMLRGLNERGIEEPLSAADLRAVLGKSYPDLRLTVGMPEVSRSVVGRLDSDLPGVGPVVYEGSQRLPGPNTAYRENATEFWPRDTSAVSELPTTREALPPAAATDQDWDDINLHLVELGLDENDDLFDALSEIDGMRPTDRGFHGLVDRILSYLEDAGADDPEGILDNFLHRGAADAPAAQNPVNVEAFLENLDGLGADDNEMRAAIRRYITENDGIDAMTDRQVELLNRAIDNGVLDIDDADRLRAAYFEQDEFPEELVQAPHLPGAITRIEDFPGYVDEPVGNELARIRVPNMGHNVAGVGDNLLGWSRSDRRTTDDGKSIRLISEVQSDWHRKNRGSDLGGIGPGSGYLPDAPFRKTQGEYELRRNLIQAIEDGDDYVGIVQAPHQAQLNPALGSRLKGLEWFPHTEDPTKIVVRSVDLNGEGRMKPMSHSEIKDAYGPEALRRMLTEGDEGVIRDLKLMDIKPGTRLNYDKKYLQDAEKLAKQWGGELVEVKVPSESNVSRSMMEAMSALNRGDFAKARDYFKNTPNLLDRAVSGGVDQAALFSALDEMNSGFLQSGGKKLRTLLDGIKDAKHTIKAIKITDAMKEKIRKAGGVPLFTAAPLGGISQADSFWLDSVISGATADDDETE